MNVFLYSRVSTSKQEFKRQIREMKEFAAKKKWKVLGEFSEKISGRVKGSDRPEYSRMMHEINSSKTKIDKVITLEISRMGRNALQVKESLEEITNKGISVYILNYNLQTLRDDGTRDPIANLIISILAELAQMELETTKERIISGLLDSALMGRAGGGASIAYGFMRDNKKMLVINEEEAEIVRQIYRLSLGGMGIKRIADYLNEKGILTRGNKSYKHFNYNDTKHDPKKIRWAGNTVLGILRNPLYKGERSFKNQTIVLEEVIVSREIWESVQSNLTKNYNQNSRNTKHFYLLKDLIKCSVCGRNYTGKKRTDGSDNYYHCSSRLMEAGGCGNPGINIDELEAAIWRMISVRKETLKTVKDNYLNHDYSSEKSKIELTIKEKEKEISKSVTEIGNLIKLCATSISADAVKLTEREINKRDKALATLQNEQSQLFVKLGTIQTKEEGLNAWKTVMKTIQRMKKSKKDIRDVLEKVVEKIRIKVLPDKKAELEIYFLSMRTPLKGILDIPKKEINIDRESVPKYPTKPIYGPGDYKIIFNYKTLNF